MGFRKELPYTVPPPSDWGHSAEIAHHHHCSLYQALNNFHTPGPLVQTSSFQTERSNGKEKVTPPTPKSYFLIPLTGTKTP